MMEFLKPLVLVGGLLFLIVGLNVAEYQHPEFAAMLEPLYFLCLWTLYIIIAILMLGLIVQAIEFAKKSLDRRSDR